jgi:hypothetical protein
VPRSCAVRILNRKLWKTDVVGCNSKDFVPTKFKLILRFCLRARLIDAPLQAIKDATPFSKR